MKKHIKHIKKHIKRGFSIISMLRKKESNLNMIITVFAVIMIRRGTRGLLDKYLFPNHEILSYIVSIIIGLIILRLDDKQVKELGHH